ncbi:MAG TPA: GNAT family N-acetyltransferase [Chitinophagaceae bacterium]|jgi:RimJ/RimL family protein N-acetyltransferase|nr:GNAT family N-acetyltransferase [Chitinophagaceae bacterium]
MKVVLREWKKSDATALAKIANNKKIWDNVRDRLPYPYTKKDAKEWLALVKKYQTVTTFCIEADGEMAGSIGFTLKEDVYRKNAEIGYFIAEEYWGKGVATEAVKQIVDYIQKNFEIVRVYAEVFEYNKSSMKVLEKNGFYLECIRKKAAVKNDMILDDYVWVKLLE